MYQPPSTLQRDDILVDKYKLVQRLDRFPVFPSLSDEARFTQVEPLGHVDSVHTPKLGTLHFPTRETEGTLGKKELGRGQYGVVWKAQVEDSNEFVAIKIPTSSQANNEVGNEIKAMQQLEGCDNVVKLRDHFNGKLDRFTIVTVIVLDFFDGGTIADFTKDFFYAGEKVAEKVDEMKRRKRKKEKVPTENQMVRKAMETPEYWENQKIFFRDLAPQLAAALECIASKNWIVRDFKSPNALVMKANSEKGTPIKAVVADLGGAKKFTVTKNGKFLSVPHWGTPLTASKFVEEGKLSYLYRSPARVNDNWSLGMTLLYSSGFCSVKAGNENCIQLNPAFYDEINRVQFWRENFACTRRGDNSSCAFWTRFEAFLNNENDFGITVPPDVKRLMKCAPFSELLGFQDFQDAKALTMENFGQLDSSSECPKPTMKLPSRYGDALHEIPGLGSQQKADTGPVIDTIETGSGSSSTTRQDNQVALRGTDQGSVAAHTVDTQGKKQGVLAASTNSRI
eukprot:g1354.t1